MSQGNYFPPSHAPGGKKSRNKQGNRSQPLRAWKGIAERLERDYPPYERPAAITRPLTKTGRPRKRMNTQEREQRKQAREANKRSKAEVSEHQRRSEAARKGWEKIPKAERTRRAKKGWDTRDEQRGMPREYRGQQRLADTQRELSHRRRQPQGGNIFGHLPRGDDIKWPF